MQIVRELKKVTGRQITIELPDSFYAKEVEVLVIPYQEVVPIMNSEEWKQDFLSVSQWDISEDDVRMPSWTIEEF